MYQLSIGSYQIFLYFFLPWISVDSSFFWRFLDVLLGVVEVLQNWEEKDNIVSPCCLSNEKPTDEDGDVIGEGELEVSGVVSCWEIELDGRG